MTTDVLRACVATAMLLGLLTGCSVSGTWRTVAIDPPGVPFPLDTLTLGANEQYTATWSHDGRTQTSTGAYRWGRSKLTIMRSGHASVTYGAKRRRDGTLVLTFGEGQATVRATLEQQNE